MAFSYTTRYPNVGVDRFKFATDPIPDPTGDAIAAGLVRDTRVVSMKADNPPPDISKRLPRMKVIGGS